MSLLQPQKNLFFICDAPKQPECSQLTFKWQNAAKKSEKGPKEIEVKLSTGDIISDILPKLYCLDCSTLEYVQAMNMNI